MDLSERWRGRQVCFLGDSITDGIGTKPGKRYFDYLAAATGMIAHGFGVNGSSFCGLDSQIDRMKAECGDRVDAVFIFCGTNDFYKNTPIGVWFTEQTETVVTTRDDNGNPLTSAPRLKRVPNADTSTFCGVITHILLRLRHDYPRAAIVLMTPLHRAFACFGSSNIQYDELYANSLGNFLDAYVDKVKEAANLFAAELIDLNAASGLFPLDERHAALYFSGEGRAAQDNLHPNSYGHKRIAQAILHRLPSIPVGDPEELFPSANPAH